MDKEYWDEYYKKKKAVHFPSPFTEYCVEKGLVKNSAIVDIGCGNGRDSFYFMENDAKYIVGIDQSEVAVKNNTATTQSLNIKFKNNIIGVQFHPEKSHKFGASIFHKFSTEICNAQT